MKRISLSLLATLLAVGTIVSSLQAASLDEVRAEFSEKFPQIKPESIHKGPVEGLLEIRQGTLVAYLTEDGRYLFQGALIDLDSNVNLTDVAASGGRKDLMQASNEDAQIVFAPEKPRYSVAVFTDIDCTFCRKLHREITAYQQEGIEIRYLLYPRGGPGSKSWQKAEDVMCADDRNRAITAAKNDQLVLSKACSAATMVADSYRLGQEVGLQGTPALVLDSGELVSGYLSAKDLLRKLQSAETASGGGE